MGSDPQFAESARSLAKELVSRGLTLVYGGGDVGLMGVMAQSTLNAGGEVIGVIPKVLMDRELGLDDATELHIVESMHERKMLMAEKADGFIALPGGIGTLEELFEILTWAYIGLHRKPCGLLNVEHYFDSMISFLKHTEANGFLHQSFERFLMVHENPVELLDAMESHTLPEVETVIEKARESKN